MIDMLSDVYYNQVVVDNYKRNVILSVSAKAKQLTKTLKNSVET